MHIRLLWFEEDRYQTKLFTPEKPSLFCLRGVELIEREPACVMGRTLQSDALLRGYSPDTY
jgi:hypothetical protein